VREIGTSFWLSMIQMETSYGQGSWEVQVGTDPMKSSCRRKRDAYVAGHTLGGLDGNTSAGGDDLFLVKYDTNGNKLWTRQLGTSSLDGAYGVAVDGSGNAYVAGHTLGGLDGNTSAGGDDLFLVKYDTNGNKLWTRQLGSSSWDQAVE